jgi:hypothetical protein
LWPDEKRLDIEGKFLTMDVEIPYLKCVVNLPDGLASQIDTCVVPGALDREKIISAMCAIRLAGVASRRLTVLSIGDEAPALEKLAKLTCSFFGYEAVIEAFPSSIDIDTLSKFAPSCLLISIPEKFLGRSDIILALAEKMTPGGTVFLASLSGTSWGASILPKRHLLEELEQLGYEAAQISYFALYRKRLRPAASRIKLTAREQERCLFVIGHARSGSSSIAHVICDQPDCMMTFEANWFIPENRVHPVDQFNFQRVLYGRRANKTQFLPDFLPASVTVEDIFRFGLDRFSVFGEKTGLGIRESIWIQHPAVLALQYQMENFPWANYVVTIRTPQEAILANHKIKPNYPITEHILWWLKMMETWLPLLSISDRCIFLPFDWSRSGRLTSVERLLSRDLPHPNFTFTENAVTTDKESTERFWAYQSDEVRTLARDAEVEYSSLVSLLDETTGRLKLGLDRGLLEELHDRLVRLSAKAEGMLLR